MTRVARLVNRRKWASAMPMLVALLAQLLLVQLDSRHHAQLLAQGPWSASLCRSATVADPSARAVRSDGRVTEPAPAGSGQDPACCSLAGLATPLLPDAVDDAVDRSTALERPTRPLPQARADTPWRVTAARGPPASA